MNKRNVQRLIEHLEVLPPEEYDQRYWNCGTRGCIAFHTIMLEEYAVTSEGQDMYTFVDGTMVPNHSVCMNLKTREKMTIKHAAQKILGLTQDCADRLFGASTWGWRHHEEFLKAKNEGDTVRVAIKELKDLLKKGSYRGHLDLKQRYLLHDVRIPEVDEGQTVQDEPNQWTVPISRVRRTKVRRVPALLHQNRRVHGVRSTAGD